MNSKFTIDSTTDGSAKLHEAIAGSCIVDVLVNGVPVEEADLSSDFRSVTLKMDNGTEVEFKSKSIDPYTGKVTQSTPAVAARTWHHTAMSAATFTLSALLAYIATGAICKRIRGRN